MNYERLLIENQMKVFFFGVILLCVSCSKKIQFVEQQQMQLSNPIIESDSIFFTQELNVKLVLALDDVEIRYTLDDSEPRATSNLFSGELILSESANVKARAFHSDYQPSEIISTQFIKTNASNPVRSTTLNREPHENYQGTGSLGLTDYVKGTNDYKSKAWLGFSGGDLEMVLEIADNKQITEVILSLFSHQSAWIFLPKNIEIYTANQEDVYTFVATKNIAVTEQDADSEFRFVKIEFSEREVNFVKIIIKNIKEIPAWHPGKGTPPWLFIDEVLVK